MVEYSSPLVEYSSLLVECGSPLVEYSSPLVEYSSPLVDCGSLLGGVWQPPSESHTSARQVLRKRPKYYTTKTPWVSPHCKAG